jgi:uncharacterized RDD family membrane protein YckC
MPSIEIKTAQNVTIEYELASLRERILASFIDLVIVGTGTFMIFFLFIMGITDQMNDAMIGRILGFLPLFGFILYQYFSELLSDGQSLGKKAMGIKVVRLDGKQPGSSDYLLRAVFHVADTIFTSGILAAMVISTTAKRQRLGDLTANTTVIRKDLNQRFRLEDILNIQSLENYTPSYPEVKMLTDEDMLTIKSVISRYRKYQNEAHNEILDQVVKHLQDLLNIPQYEGTKIEFLQTLLRDYIVLTR